ncbi:hypothetical protein BGW80DRAFT_809764 [Lactifluus volemus]|nr:hypothetical protein BGW80DRAFT_809764 [Lactifluus volemus]
MLRISFTGRVIPRHRILADKKRAAVFHPGVTYSFQNYLAYPLYPTPYIARTISTFNDFMLQLTHPKVITPPETVLCVLHFLISLLTMEIVIHVKHART